MANLQQDIALFKLAMKREYPVVDLDLMYKDLKRAVKEVDCTKTNCPLLRVAFRNVRTDWKILKKGMK